MRVVVSERGCRDPAPSAANEAWTYSLSRYWQFLRKVLYRRASVVTALNRDSALWIGEECGVPVRVIPVAVRDLADIVAEREPMVLAVGRLHAVKGFDVLLRAFGKVLPAFPNWRLTIIGTGPARAISLMQNMFRAGRFRSSNLLDPVQDIETWMARHEPGRSAVAIRGIRQRRDREHGHGSRGGGQQLRGSCVVDRRPNERAVGADRRRARVGTGNDGACISGS